MFGNVIHFYFLVIVILNLHKNEPKITTPIEEHRSSRQRGGNEQKHHVKQNLITLNKKEPKLLQQVFLYLGTFVTILHLLSIINEKKEPETDFNCKLYFLHCHSWSDFLISNRHTYADKWNESAQTVLTQSTPLDKPRKL